MEWEPTGSSRVMTAVPQKRAKRVIKERRYARYWEGCYIRYGKSGHKITGYPYLSPRDLPPQDHRERIAAPRNTPERAITRVNTAKGRGGEGEIRDSNSESGKEEPLR